MPLITVNISERAHKQYKRLSKKRIASAVLSSVLEGLDKEFIERQRTIQAERLEHIKEMDALFGVPE